MPTSFDSSAVRQVLRRVFAGTPNEFGAAQFAETQVEAKESAERAPELSGKLRASIEAVGPEFKAKTILTAVIAGAPGSGAEEYALDQHENFDLEHKIGGPKYIESTLNESASSILARIGNRIDLNRITK